MIVDSPTIRFDIYMAGDLAQAKQVCREFCFSVGFCVHIEPVDFIYTGGEESGFKVGLVNYPRFQTDYGVLLDKARKLGSELQQRLCQHSYLVVGPDSTEWHTRREDSK